MNIHESAEDYLEAILRLKEAKGYARSVDISLLLGVTKPSVSVAMKRLRENGYLTMDTDNLITLTPAGMEIARSIYDRHKTLSSFLESLGVIPMLPARTPAKLSMIFPRNRLPRFGS